MNGKATPSMFTGHSMLCPYDGKGEAGGSQKTQRPFAVATKAEIRRQDAGATRATQYERD